MSVLLWIVASHSWCLTFEHCHQTFFPEPFMTLFGVNSPFLVSCHSFAISGEIVAKQFSMDTFLLAQNGQPLFDIALLFTVASHSWCLTFEHCHQTFLWEPLVTSEGFKSPFLVSCHSFEISGETVPKSFLLAINLDNINL